MFQHKYIRIGGGYRHSLLFVRAMLEETELRVSGCFKLIFLFLVREGPFCRTTDCTYFGLYMTLPMGFKARVVLLPACLLLIHKFT